MRRRCSQQCSASLTPRWALTARIVVDLPCSRETITRPSDHQQRSEKVAEIGRGQQPIHAIIFLVRMTLMALPSGGTRGTRGRSRGVNGLLRCLLNPRYAATSTRCFATINAAGLQDSPSPKANISCGCASAAAAAGRRADPPWGRALAARWRRRSRAFGQCGASPAFRAEFLYASLHTTRNGRAATDAPLRACPREACVYPLDDDRPFELGKYAGHLQEGPACRR